MNTALIGVRNICATVTPFTKNSEVIDHDSHERHLHWLKKNGVQAIVSLGTTGESPTIPFNEHTKAITDVVHYSPLPVIAGAGANSTSEAIHLTEQAERSGAVAILSVVPYYNKPNQEGLFRHYRNICRCTSLPVILYNVPGRTKITLDVETTLRIRDVCSNFAAVKEASDNFAAVQRYVREGVIVYCGEDALNFPMLCLGAVGVISVVSNFAPIIVGNIIYEVRRGRLQNARVINNMMVDLAKAAFIDTNPIPTKFICSEMGFCENLLRLPLTILSREKQKIVKKIMKCIL